MHRRTWRRAKARPSPWMSASSSQVAGSRPYFTEPHPFPMNKRQTLAPTVRRRSGPARCARPDAVRHPSGEEVVAATDGPTQAADTLRTALAMGAVHFLHEPEGPARPLLPLAVAKVLQALALQEKPGLVILGKQAIDDDCNQTGQMLAALLNWPQGTFASKVVIDKEKQIATVEREVDGGTETICLDLPAVITTDLRLNQPRYATLPNIMKAKSKVIKKVTPAELNVDIRSDMEVVQVDEPPKRKAGVILSSVDELLDRLKNEARVM